MKFDVNHVNLYSFRELSLKYLIYFMFTNSVAWAKFLLSVSLLFFKVFNVILLDRTSVTIKRSSPGAKYHFDNNKTQ